MTLLSEATVRNDGCVFRQMFQSRRMVQDAGGTIVNCSINAGNSLRVDPLVNGNFEGAAGPAGWTAMTATMSRESGTRTGGTGSYVCQVAYNGVNPTGRATQNVFTVGVLYKVEGWYKTDGVTSVTIQDGLAGITGTFAASATWAQFSVVGVAAFARLDLMSASLMGAGNWMQFDDVTVTPLIGGAGLGPKAPSGRITYDKTQDLLINKNKMTIRVRFRTESNLAINTDMIAKISSAYNDNQFLVYFLSAAGPKIGLLIAASASDVGNYSFCSGTTMVASTEYIWHGVYDGTLAAASRVTHYVNGLVSAATIGGTIPVSMRASNVPLTVFNPNGGSTRAPNLTLYDFCIWNKALSAAEVLDDAMNTTYSEVL